MKAISIRQPHADRVVSGQKPLELRGWETSYRGPLLIVSGLSVDDQEMRKLGISPQDVEARFVLGRALGVVDMVDCRPIRRGDEVGAYVGAHRLREFKYAHVYANARRFKGPFKVRGQLNIYDVPWFDIYGRESLLR